MSNEQVSADIDFDSPLILVTADSHIGPRLKEDLREYCPREYLEEYDAYVKAYEPFSDPSKLSEGLVGDKTPGAEGADPASDSMYNDTAGHYDVHQRLKDMDRDGVAAEVIFHGSQNGQCFPLLPVMGGTFNAMVFAPGTCSAHELDLAAVGQHMYNRWLADQCSVEPERHAGLAHVPMWDIDAAIKELEWASDAGLRGVNFPAPKLGIPPYDERDWDPFWAVCADRGMVLSTHAGADIDTLGSAHPHTLIVLDISEVPDKVLPRLIFSGVFERHPKLKLALTELQRPYSRWWRASVEYYDELWEANRDLLKSQVPRPPSQYMANFYHGNSLLFLAPEEVSIGERDGYAAKFMWGSDYPHGEGPYRIPRSDDEETRTVMSLRHALSGADPLLARRIAGENAVEAYSLDRERLTAVAERIKAINLRTLLTPLESVPADWAALARFTLPFPEYHRQMEGV